MPSLAQRPTSCSSLASFSCAACWAASSRAGPPPCRTPMGAPPPRARGRTCGSWPRCCSRLCGTGIRMWATWPQFRAWPRQFASTRPQTLERRASTTPPSTPSGGAWHVWRAGSARGRGRTGGRRRSPKPRLGRTGEAGEKGRPELRDRSHASRTRGRPRRRRIAPASSSPHSPRLPRPPERQATALRKHRLRAARSASLGTLTSAAEACASRRLARPAGPSPSARRRPRGRPFGRGAGGASWPRRRQPRPRRSFARSAPTAVPRLAPTAPPSRASARPGWPRALRWRRSSWRARPAGPRCWRRRMPSCCRPSGGPGVRARRSRPREPASAPIGWACN
mmetsp:Transcript_24995/g.80758  ORF Transcript_24995/g.80758 Transcript_24995/m.80758 type:complete len:338 (-) Transcript_24995:279-1292(-)